MAAVLSCEMGQTETIVAMREECLRMGLTVHKPDINRSHARFTVPAPRQIDYGLAAIKGVGQGAVDSILSARDAHGLFRDLFDFCRRIDLKRVNKRVLEALVMAGALDGLGLNRASLMRNLPTALQMAEREAEAHVTGQNDMFGLGTDSQAERITVKAEIVDDWDLRQRLDHEKATLGFYLSGHPLDAFRELIEQTCSGTSLRALLDRHALPAPVGADGKRIWQPRQRVMFAAWVVDVRFFKGDKNGFGRSALPSYRITLEDPGAQIATWIDGEKWPEIQAFVKPEQMIFVTAEIGLAPAKDGREAEPRLYAPEFLSLDRLMEDHASRVRLCFRRPLRDVTQLRDALSPYRSPRGAAVEVEYQASDGAIGATAVLDLGDAWRLRVHRASLAAVQRLLGAECVKVSYKAYVPPVVERRFERSFVAAADDE
jgi:DNA polymerase-3 subunit alpha